MRDKRKFTQLKTKIQVGIATGYLKTHFWMSKTTVTAEKKTKKNADITHTRSCTICHSHASLIYTVDKTSGVITEIAPHIFCCL
jgi:hypothetical protein